MKVQQRERRGMEQRKTMRCTQSLAAVGLSTLLFRSGPYPPIETPNAKNTIQPHTAISPNSKISHKETVQLKTDNKLAKDMARLFFQLELRQWKRKKNRSTSKRSKGSKNVRKRREVEDVTAMEMKVI